MKKKQLPENFGEFKKPTTKEKKLILQSLAYTCSESMLKIIINIAIEIPFVLMFFHKLTLNNKIALGVFVIIFNLLYRIRFTIINMITQISLSMNEWEVMHVKAHDIKCAGFGLRNSHPLARIQNENCVLYDKFFVFSKNEIHHYILKNYDMCNIALIQKNNKYICVLLRNDTPV